MGTLDSTFDVDLIPPASPLFCQETRFCFADPVSVRLREKSFDRSGGSFECIGGDGKAWFRVVAKPNLDPLRAKKTISDVFGSELFRIEVESRKQGAQIKVYSGLKGMELMNVDVELTAGLVMASASVSNISSSSSHRITYRGNMDKAGAFYFGDFQKGGSAIARRVPAKTYDSKAYDLTVANNVDVSMCVAISLAIDEIMRGTKL